MSAHYMFRIVLCIASLMGVTFFQCMDAPRIIQRIIPGKEIFIQDKGRYTLVGEHDKIHNRYHVAKHWDHDHITEKANPYRAFKKLKTSFHGQQPQPNFDKNVTEED